MGLMWTAARGAAAGALGTWVMDRVTTAMYERQDAADTEREQAAWPNGKPSLENLVDRATAQVGLSLRPEAREGLLQLTHYGLGIGPGVLYALLRRRVPLLGAGRGFVFGLLLFAVNDELLNTALGLSGPPEAYPAASHLRGLVGHVALGITTDLALIDT